MVKNYENTANPFGKRILELMKEYNVDNLNVLSLELGMSSNSVVTRLFSDEKKKFSMRIIQKFLERFKDLNARWFITGEGQMREKTGVIQINTDEGHTKDEKIKDLLLRIEDKDQIINLQKDRIKQLENK